MVHGILGIHTRAEKVGLGSDSQDPMDQIRKVAGFDEDIMKITKKEEGRE